VQALSLKKVVKMKFKGTGIVWDAENNKVLVEFENGIVDTTDQRVIDILSKNGFQELNDVQNLETQQADDNSDVEAEDTIEQSNPKLNWNEIKRKAISLGIKVKGKSKDELLSLIGEK
jgi:hypothetical protein